VQSQIKLLESLADKQNSHEDTTVVMAQSEMYPKVQQMGLWKQIF
jgi:hypothetical protein